MWDYLLVLLSIAIVIAAIWLSLPYSAFKKNIQKLEEQPITINDGKQVISLSQYQQSNKNKSYLSLVVPSYNEQERLPVMLQQTAEFLKKQSYSFQIIVVDDGSKDKTAQTALKTAQSLKINLIVVSYPKNRGKGGAVRAGVAVAKGNYVLMVDADGATKFSELQRCLNRIVTLQKLQNSSGLAMVVGSRRVAEQKVSRKPHRRLVSWVFKTIIGVLLGIKTKDTQCGFKLFNLQTAKLLFQIMHIQRFAFDVQLFFISQGLKVEIAEQGVEWHDVDGSKLSVLDASVNMLRDVLTIRIYYLLGLWRLADRIAVR